MNMNKKKDPQRPRRISNLFKRITNIYGKIQKKCLQKAQEFGYSKDVFEETGSKFQELSDTPALENVEETLKHHIKFVEGQERDTLGFLNTIDTDHIAYSTATTASVTAFTSYQDYVLTPLGTPPSWTPDRHEEYAKKLSKLDKELGRTYRSIWEIFHGTTESPEKLALAAMRQAFDHFFRILTPAEKVRESPYFTENKEPKIHQIYREERLVYVANVQMRDK